MSDGDLMGIVEPTQAALSALQGRYSKLHAEAEAARIAAEILCKERDELGRAIDSMQSLIARWGKS